MIPAGSLREGRQSIIGNRDMATRRQIKVIAIGTDRVENARQVPSRSVMRWRVVGDIGFRQRMMFDVAIIKLDAFVRVGQGESRFRSRSTRSG